MKISNVTTSHCNYVTIGNDEYIRFGSEAWYKSYGMSYESIWSYDIDVLESAYQEYIKSSGNRNNG